MGLLSVAVMTGVLPNAFRLRPIQRPLGSRRPVSHPHATMASGSDDDFVVGSAPAGAAARPGRRAAPRLACAGAGEQGTFLAVACEQLEPAGLTSL